MRVSMIPRMAAEIGLHLPCRYSIGPEMSAEEVEILRKNDIRTRAFIIINEHRYVSIWPPELDPCALIFHSSFFTFSGRPAMDTSQFELTEVELDEITDYNGDQTFTSLAASYHLFLFDVRCFRFPTYIPLSI
jgi:hypothetical protein